MSRTTQYIGLTQYAINWVEKATKVETYEMTHGMFGEVVEGSIFYMPPPKGPNKALIAKEVVQEAPWSGGPMIFTHLELILIKDEGSEVQMGTALSWVVNPGLENCEFDRELGHYYV